MQKNHQAYASANASTPPFARQEVSQIINFNPSASPATPALHLMSGQALQTTAVHPACLQEEQT